MSTRNLDALFAPKAIALIGASNEQGSLGAVLTRNMFAGGFAGPIWPVNPHESEIAGRQAYASVADLPGQPDLAVIATPARTVPGLLAELAGRGCRAAVIITAGLGTAEAREAMFEAARPSLLRIAGPNCLGFLSPARGINASFAHLSPREGSVALIAQSGAVTTAALDWAEGRGLGFSHVVTLGDMADVDFGDLLEWLAGDEATSAVMLYVETITHARKFMAAARRAARSKPVVVVKAGRSEAGAKAAFSHTGALAGSDLVYEAAFHRAGLVRADTLREMFDAVATLTSGLRTTGDRLAIITNGGGAGVMAADALEAARGQLAVLSPQTYAALDAALPSTWSKSNPVDIIGDAPPARYDAAVRAVLADPGVDAVLALNCPTALADSAEGARAVLGARTDADRPLLTCWLGDPAARPARRLFAEANVPTYETPEEAVGAFMHMTARERTLRLLDSPPESPPERSLAEARVLIDSVRASGRSRLSEPEAKALFAAYGVPILESRLAPDPPSAAAVAARLQGPFAVKIHSPDITHKSDVGGVALNLPAPDAVQAAAEDMLKRVRLRRPDARIDGFIVQQMALRPMARELIVGLSSDAVFGPVVMFGQGGVEVEVAADRVIGLPPLGEALALDMISRTRVARRLAAWRDHPAADLGAVAGVLVALARLALDFPEVAELDINPLLADQDGVLAMDARVRLADPATLTPPALG